MENNKTIKKLVEYIYNSGEDICQVCINKSKCNEKCMEDDDFTPNKTECLDGIEKYFSKA